MYEEYVREDKIKDKTDEEKRLELIMSIIKPSKIYMIQITILNMQKMN